MVVETALPNRNDFGVSGQLSQLLNGRIGLLFCFRGVDSDRGIDLGIGIRKGKGDATAFQIGSNGYEACHACIKSSLDYLGTVCIKVRKVEVAMSIDQHSVLNLVENRRKRRLL